MAQTAPGQTVAKGVSENPDFEIDIRNLTFEPEFYKYVKPAFSPVGLMIDVWEKSCPADSKLTVPVYLINDLAHPVEKVIILTLEKDGKMIAILQKPASAKEYEVKTVRFKISIPEETGEYQLKATISVDGEEVFSVRDIFVVK